MDFSSNDARFRFSLRFDTFLPCSSFEFISHGTANPCKPSVCVQLRSDAFVESVLLIFQSDWQAGIGQNHGKWACQACRDSIWRDMPSALKHETRQTHESALEFRLSTANTSPTVSDVPAREAVHGPLYELLRELSDPDLPDVEPRQLPREQELDWDAMGDSFEGGIAPPHVAAAVAALALSLEEWMADDGAETEINSDEVPDERSEESSPEHGRGEGMFFSSNSPSVLLKSALFEGPIMPGTRRARRHGDDNPEDPEWFPWVDKEVCSTGDMSVLTFAYAERPDMYS